jgi:hypothetical protein
MKIAARYWLRFFTLASLGLMLNILIGSSFAALSAPELAACAALVQNNAHELFLRVPDTAGCCTGISRRGSIFEIIKCNVDQSHVIAVCVCSPKVVVYFFHLFGFCFRAITDLCANQSRSFCRATAAQSHLCRTSRPSHSCAPCTSKLTSSIYSYWRTKRFACPAKLSHGIVVVFNPPQALHASSPGSGLSSTL